MARQTKGRLFQRGKKGTYYLEYFINGKRFQKRLVNDKGESITIKKEADKAKDKILSPIMAKDEVQRKELMVSALESEKDNLKRLDLELKAIPLDQAWNEYTASPNTDRATPQTEENYARHLKFFIQFLNDNYSQVTFIQQVTPEIALEFAKATKQNKVSANTYNKRMGFLKKMYALFMEDNKIDVNPFQSIKRIKQKASNSKEDLPLETIQKILEVSEPEYRLLFLVALYTGLRRGDCCTLQWSDICLESGILTRIPNKIKTRSDKPKTVKIGLPANLLNVLCAIPEDQRGEYVFPTLAEYYIQNKEDRINRKVKKYFTLGGVLPEDYGKKYGFHSFRYTYISLHAQSGTPQSLIQDNAGHSNPAMTQHYTKVSDDVARNIAMNLPDVIETIATEVNSNEISQLERDREELLQFVRNASGEHIDVLKCAMNTIISEV